MSNLERTLYTSSVFLISLILITFPVNEALGYPWPFEGSAGDTPTTEQQRVRDVIGAYRDLNRFHNGIDISPRVSSNNGVFTVADGTVDATSTWDFVDDDGARHVGVRIDYGGFELSYVHTIPVEGLNGGLTVSKGQRIGALQSLGNHACPILNHVHLKHKDGHDVINNLTKLENYTDDREPVITNVRFYDDRENPERSSATSLIKDPPVIYKILDHLDLLESSGHDPPRRPAIAS